MRDAEGAPRCFQLERVVEDPVELARAWLLTTTTKASPWFALKKVDDIKARKDKLAVWLTLDKRVSLDQAYLQDALLAFANTMDQVGIRSVFVYARWDVREQWVPIDLLVGYAEPVPKKPGEINLKIEAQPSWPNPLHPQGALSGKSIFISQSHGWYYDSGVGEWVTQRGNTNDLVEDFINAEAVNQYLIHYLWNAGAGVYTCRERDMNSNQVIVDNGDPGYQEVGSWSDGTASSGYWGSGYRVAEAVSGVSAEWVLDPPQPGFYSLYAWYRGGSDKAQHALYVVHHHGGETEVEVDQRRDGYTWRFLGFFYFSPNDDPSMRRVVLLPGQDEPGSLLVADAVRAGGGMGSVEDGGSVSGRPRWEESGLYFAPFMGCSSCQAGTVSTMPRYAKWENEDWENSVYVSWHTNAPNPGTGTSSFVYSSQGWDGPFDGVEGSQELQQYVHDEIINDIRAGYDPSWTDRGKHTAQFGEVSPYNNDEMPSVLIELAFHDTPSDAEYLKDPKFRMLAARAIYQGIVKFFAWKDGTAVHLLPEPPTHLAVRSLGGGKLLLSWHEPPYDQGDGLLGDPAEGYRVWMACGNHPDFSLVAEVASTSCVLEGFEPGELYLFRVTAYNQGGESFPTPALPFREPQPGASKVVVVDGFDRLDKYALVWRYESDRLGWVQRMFLDVMNTFDYAGDHAEAMASVDVGIDSCLNEAVESGDVELGQYAAVDWVLGEESSVDETFSEAEQEKVSQYLDGGGRLLVTGAELAWDLDHLGSAADKAFINSYLHAAYSVDDSGSYTVEAISGGPLEGMVQLQFDDGTGGIYEVGYPDGLSPTNGGEAAAGYVGTSETACVSYSSNHRTMVCGFPLETVVDPSSRADFMERSMEFLLEGRGCLPGDANMNGVVDGADTNALMGVLFGNLPCACPDVDCSGSIDARDLSALVMEAASPGSGPCQ